MVFGILTLALMGPSCVKSADDPSADPAAEDSAAEEQEEEAVDSDGDGLTDEEEEAFGSDPNSSDSDGDGLSDAEEYELQSDPNAEDSDGDGYLDPHEVAEGSDPNDASSMIYAGGWPYNPDKDDIADPGWSDGGAETGETFWRFSGVDQYGDVVDLYDFAGQGKYIVLDLSAEWCGYCKELAKVIEGSPSYFDDFTGSYPILGELKELIENGDIYWVTVLDQKSNGSPADGDTVASWAEDYPNPHVPILADSEQLMFDYLDGSGWPSVVVLDSDMELDINKSSYLSTLSSLYNRLN